MNESRKVIRMLVVICSLFFIIVGYLTYIQLFESKKLMTNTYNRRQYQAEEATVRGSVYDRKGILLASSIKIGKDQERQYPYGSLYSQVIGYSSKVYGKSLLESSYNKYLLGIDEYSQAFGILGMPINNAKKGNDINLTIDHELQTLGEKLLRGKKGAVVAIDPNSGEVLALVSKPDFDPANDKLESNWRDMVESEDYPFLPRAFHGLYAPGSTFKVLTTAAIIESGLDKQKFSDKGSVVIDGMKISNSKGKAHGDIGLEEAFVVSSNVVYSQLGVQLGSDKLHSMVSRMGMEKDIPFEIQMPKSIFPYEGMQKTEMAAVAIGQGKLLVTPLHMALLASSVANKGIMMKPILVKDIVSPEKKNLKSTKPVALYNVMAPETASRIKKMMTDVVKKGTGKSAAIKGVEVAGKTGTAENELTVKKKGKEHAWFIGFAPAENPKIAVAVIIEYGGSGGSVAAPIAKQIISTYLK